MAGAAGLGFDGSPPAAIITGFIVLVGVVAIGSLLVTIAALVAAPQVYVVPADDRLLGRAGPRAAVADRGIVRPTRLVTRPMLALIVLGVLAGLAGVLSLSSTLAG